MLILRTIGSAAKNHSPIPAQSVTRKDSRMSVDHTAADAALARMASIFDLAAERENVSPEEFRAGLSEAIAYAKSLHGETISADCTPEAFVLAVVERLF